MSGDGDGEAEPVGGAAGLPLASAPSMIGFRLGFMGSL